MTDQPDQNGAPPPPRDSAQSGLRRTTWLLIALIILFFAIGIVFVTSGLLVPGQGVDPPPGPTAFTLTPQLTAIGTPLP